MTVFHVIMTNLYVFISNLDVTETLYGSFEIACARGIAH